MVKMKGRNYDFEALIRGLESYIGTARMRRGMSFEQFDQAWSEYGLDETNLTEKTKQDTYARLTHKFAGGKESGFARDRATRSRQIVTSIEQYRKKGTGRVDLQGVDTPTRRGIQRVEPKRFTIVGSQKGKTRYGRVETIKVRGKKIIKLRGKDGRFLKRVR